MVASALLGKKPSQQRNPCYQRKRNKNAKLPMLGLVAKEQHAQQGACRAAKHGKQNECSLGYAPPTTLRLPLVDAIGGKGDEIDSRQIIR